MNYLPSNSSNCSFRSSSLEGDNLYEAIEIGPILGIKTIENSISLLGDKL